MSSQIKYELLPIQGGFTGGPSNNSENYRWYQCHRSYTTLTCMKLESPTSQSLFVSKNIPEFLDTTILKYKACPSFVSVLIPHQLNEQTKEPRYYFCKEKCNSILCERLDSIPSSPCIGFAKGETRLVSINGYFPRFLDTSFLKYSWIPDRVEIVSKQ